MKLIKNTFAFIWGIRVIIWFFIVVGIATPFYLLLIAIFGNKIRLKLVTVNFRVLSPLLLALYLVRVKKYVSKEIDPKKGYVTVSNHVSYFDVLVNAKCSPQPFFFLAKKELGKVPIFGSMVKALGILVDRKDKESRRKSMEYMKRALKEGKSIFLYPEGTRNTGNEPLATFYDGAFRIALENECPVVVHTLVGTKRLNRPDKAIYALPGKVSCFVEAPIDVTPYLPDDVDGLREKVREVMLERLKAN